MSTLREAAEEALRWMEHARLHLTIKERMHPDGLSLYDSAAEALRAALAEPKTELRDQHKAFTHWYFGLRGINEANFSPEDLAWAAWKAALAQPEVPCHVGDARKHVICVCPDCVATNYREWCEAVHADLVTTWTFSAENKDDPRKALQDIINWHVSVSLDPAVSSDAQALIERGKAMRDEWRLASEPPEDGRDVVVWCAQERRAVHGMYVRRHPPVVGLVDGWVAPDASKLTHWRDVTPPMEGE